jgi:hypothetical protein
VIKFSLIAAILLGSVACGGSKPHVGGDTVIDCAKQDFVQIATLLQTLKPLLLGNAPDWRAIEREAEKAGAAVGGCVLADVVNQWLSRPRAVEGSENAYNTLEHFRAQHGGTSYLVNGERL